MIKEEKVNYRPWQKGDFEQVIKILQESWEKAYSSFIPKSDLDFYLRETYNSEKLLELFNNPEVFCFSAEVNGKTVGWLKLVINRNEKRFYLSSIYVLPEYQKLKIGKELMQIAFSTAIEKGFQEIWIGVMEKNSKVLEWYKKIGFEFLESLPFSMGKSKVNHFIGVKRDLKKE